MTGGDPRPLDPPYKNTESGSETTIRERMAEIERRRKTGRETKPSAEGGG